MAAELGTWFYNGQEYVTSKEAARYLVIEYKPLLHDILKGSLAVVQIESSTGHRIRNPESVRRKAQAESNRVG